MSWGALDEVLRQWAERRQRDLLKRQLDALPDVIALTPGGSPAPPAYAGQVFDYRGCGEPPRGRGADGRWRSHDSAAIDIMNDSLLDEVGLPGKLE